MGKLYLIPNTLSGGDPSMVIPAGVVEIAKRLKVFVVEEERTVRRFLKLLDRSIVIDDLTFITLNEHSTSDVAEGVLPYLEKFDVGVISEAGCPAIADPGRDLVLLAHQHHFEVVPLTGPSSIVLALMASGCSGQCFAFNGYLPIPKEERIKAIKNYEHRSRVEHRSEIFIETPYRNEATFEMLRSALSPTTSLSVACNLTLEDELILTKSIAEWRASEIPAIQKRPTVFVLLA